jgi:hypothetical protein
MAMKNKIILGSALFLATTLTSCWNSHDLNVKVQDNDDMYRFSAKFENDRTRLVERVINKHIAPTHIEADGGMDVTTILDDRTKLDIETSAGEVIIKMDKNGHNQSSYDRVKRMCAEIKEVILKK